MEMETEQNVTLHPVLAMHGYSMDFSQAPGKATYRFRVESGDIETHHNSFVGRCGMWTLPPESGDAPVKVLHAGDEAEITFDSRIHDLAPDYIEISNSRYRKPAVFSFRRVKASA